MLINTHKHLANSAYDMLRDDAKELIDKPAFIKGSYYPDTNLKYRMILHDYEHTIGIIKQKIDELLFVKHDKNVLSQTLGIIAHFMADYCSPYHTNKKYMKKNLITHLAYEHKTQNSINLIFLEQSELQNRFFKNINTLPEDLRSFIDTFMQEPKDMEREVKFALTNTVHVINLIMAEYIKIHIHKDNYIDFVSSVDIPAAAYYPDDEVGARYFS